MKKILLYLITTIFVSPGLTQPPPALGPPELPIDARVSELSIGLFISKAKDNISASVTRVNRAIDSMSSGTGVRARLSHTIEIRKPEMSSTSSTQAQNFRFAKIVLKVTYSISDIHYHGVPYFSRRIFQDVILTFACDKWYTDNGNAVLRVSTDKPLLDEASFGEQALNFFFQNRLTTLLDSKLNQVLSGIGGNAFVPLSSLKCNCMSLLPGTPPQYNDAAMQFAQVFPLKAMHTQNNLVITLKSIKRLPIVDLPDPVEETFTLEFLANHKFMAQTIEKIKAGDVQTLLGMSVTTARPADNGLLVLIGNISPLSGVSMGPAGTISNSLVLRKENRFGIGTHTFTITRSFLKIPAAIPGTTPPKAHLVTRPQYEIIVQVSADGTVTGFGSQ